jgi:hypothetical protein
MSFPRFDACLVCEVVRAEPLGKVTILGFYGIAPGVGISIADFSKPIVLTFLYVGGAGAGTFVANARIIGPSGAAVDGSSVQATFDAAKSGSFLALSLQATLSGPGRYQLILVANAEQRHVTTIDFVQGDPQEMLRRLGT